MAEQLPPRRGRHRRAKRRWRLIFAALLLLVAMVAAKPLYHWVKARHANALCAEAERLVRQQKLGEAAVDYRSALKLDPLGYRPLRGAALLATRLHHSEALGLWQEVVASPRATVTDREKYAAALLQAGAFPQAQTVINGLLGQNPSTRALLLASLFAERNGDAARALEYARLATKRKPADEAAQARLAGLLAASSKPEERGEAKAILWKIISSNSAGKRPAVEALARAPELTAAEQTKLLDVVRGLSPFTINEALLAADLELRLNPQDATAIYDGVSAKWSGDKAARVALARWLNGHGQNDRVLELVPLQPGDKALLLARLDALATQKRWSEIEAALARPDLGFDATVIESFRARAAQEQQATLDAEFHWSKAIDAANNDPEKLRFIADFAEQSGATEAALQAFEQLARWPEHALVALAGQQRLAAKTRDINAARALAEKELALQNNDPDAQNRVLYYNLLLQTDVGDNAAGASALAARFPNRLEFRVTAALGCLRQHNPAGALAQFRGPPIDWSKAQPAWRAVYAATLIANDQPARGSDLIKTISPERLLPEEVALIAPATSK
jgi:hypothetical protein